MARTKQTARVATSAHKRPISSPKRQKVPVLDDVDDVCVFAPIKKAQQVPQPVIEDNPSIVPTPTVNKEGQEGAAEPESPVEPLSVAAVTVNEAPAEREEAALPAEASEAAEAAQT